MSFLSTFISLRVTRYIQMCHFFPYFNCAIIVCAFFVYAILDVPLCRETVKLHCHCHVSCKSHMEASTLILFHRYLGSKITA